MEYFSSTAKCDPFYFTYYFMIHQMLLFLASTAQTFNKPAIRPVCFTIKIDSQKCEYFYTATKRVKKLPNDCKINSWSYLFEILSKHFLAKLTFITFQTQKGIP
jgi:hypothetical protein